MKRSKRQPIFDSAHEQAMQVLHDTPENSAVREAAALFHRKLHHIESAWGVDAALTHMRRSVANQGDAAKALTERYIAAFIEGIRPLGNSFEKLSQSGLSVASAAR